MRLILSILAGLALLAGTVHARARGMRIPYNRIDALLGAAVSDDEFLQYLLQEELKTKAQDE
jgi:hypothetical protein